MELTDTALVEKWKTLRDAEAFTELVARHSVMVYRVACRILRDPGHAEEVAQECFLVLAQNPSVVRRSPAGWLHALAVSRALDRLKSERHRLNREACYAAQAATISTPRWNDVQGYVDEALADLPEPQREAVIYRYLEGHNLDETARYLSVSRSTIQRWLDTSVVEIRQYLDLRGVVLSTGALMTTLGVGSAKAAPATLTLALGKLALAGTTGSTAFSVASGVVLTGGLLVMKKILIAAGIVLAVALLTWLTFFKSSVPDSDASPALPSVLNELVKTSSLPDAESTQPAQPPHKPSMTALLTQMLKDQENGSISGIVVDPQGRPMAEMMVFNESGLPSSAETTTDTNGHFELTGLAAGQYWFLLRKEQEGLPAPLVNGDKEKGILVKLAQGEHRTGIKLVCDRVWSISGRVMDREGKPISNILLQCLGEKNGGGFARSGPDGIYRVDDLADDMYEISVEEDGKYLYRNIRGVKAGRDDVDIVLAPAFIVKGRVLDAATGRPIPEFEVALGTSQGPPSEYGLSDFSVLNRLKTVSDSEGHFSLTVTKIFTYVVAARAHGYTTESQPINEDMLQSQNEIVLRLQKGGELHGAVRNPEGQPIPDASVVYGNVTSQLGKTSVKTGKNGEFMLSSFPSQAQLISAYHPSYAIGDMLVPANRNLSKPVEIVLTKGVSLRGNVQAPDAPENAKITMRLSYPQMHWSSDDRYNTELPATGGTFEFTSLQPGKATIQMTRCWKSIPFEQFQCLEIPVVIEDGKEKVLNLDFPFSTGVIEGSVPVNPINDNEARKPR